MHQGVVGVEHGRLPGFRGEGLIVVQQLQLSNWRFTFQPQPNCEFSHGTEFLLGCKANSFAPPGCPNPITVLYSDNMGQTESMATEILARGTSFRF